MNKDEILEGIKAICAPFPECRALRDKIVTELNHLIPEMADYIIVLSHNDVAAFMVAVADIEQDEATEDTVGTLSRIASKIDQQAAAQYKPREEVTDG